VERPDADTSLVTSTTIFRGGARSEAGAYHLEVGTWDYFRMDEAAAACISPVFSDARQGFSNCMTSEGLSIEQVLVGGSSGLHRIGVN